VRTAARTKNPIDWQLIGTDSFKSKVYGLPCKTELMKARLIVILSVTYPWHEPKLDLLDGIPACNSLDHPDSLSSNSFITSTSARMKWNWCPGAWGFKSGLKTPWAYSKAINWFRLFFLMKYITLQKVIFTWLPRFLLWLLNLKISVWQMVSQIIFCWWKIITSHYFHHSTFTQNWQAFRSSVRFGGSLALLLI